MYLGKFTKAIKTTVQICNKRLHNVNGIVILLLLQTFSTLSYAQNQSHSSVSGSVWVEERGIRYRGQSYDILDTNYVPSYRMKQHRKFLNSEYNFPAKPRNMWEVGVGFGLFNVSGDVPSLMLWDRGGYGIHAHVRKAWGYSLSTRLQYIYGIGKGLQWQQSENYRWNPAWNAHYGFAYVDNQGNVYAATDKVHYNYRMESHQLNLDFIFNTNNIRFHKDKINFSFYAFLGIGGFAFNTKINALDANNQPYKFEDINGTNAGIEQVHGNRKEIRRRLMSGMDDTYETEAENERKKRRPGFLGDKSIDFAFSGGLGAQFRLSNHMNLALEYRLIFPHDEDLLDGQRWAEQVYGNPVLTTDNDKVNYLSLGLNFNLGNAKKHVEPLYWINPLDFGYGRIAAPVDPLLPDADGDGITDQFDQCPGTPEGVPVDVNGCPLDTDGDGVPDYRDKQLITPTECQPVDEDGIGKCPCPDDCAGMSMAGPCTEIGSGSFVFDDNSARIKPYNQSRLASLAALMKAHPECRVVLIGAGSGSKVQEQRSWDRVNAIITYMVERHGIDRNRFIFQYGQPGDPTVVMYRSALTGEDGPSNVAPPFPNLRRD